MSSFQIVNPATGIVERTYETASDAAVGDALARAHAAFPSWRETPVAQRAAVLARVAEIYAERADELAAIITREMGKPVKQGLGEVGISGAIYAYYAEQGPGFLADEELTVATGGSAVVRRAPIGVVLGIMPWNYPYYQVARFAAPNLLLGNTILLKHAPSCPESASVMEEIFREAGLPRDAYINVFASEEQVARLIADARLQGVSLTGSERAGAAVAEIAGRHLKRFVLELGGNDPFIVLDTDDLDGLVRTAASARMSNAGQACNSPKRMIVVDGLYDDFVAGLETRLAAMEPGDPSDAATRFGPLSSEAALDRVLELVDDARAKGADIRVGGARLDRDGAWMSPTLVTGVTPDMRLYREEAFGPVATVYRVRDVDAAVELANDTPYGLGSSVYTTDWALANEVADRLDAGMVYINAPGGTEPDVPFGGVKMSGIGRELGRYGVDEFANKKLVRAPKR